MCENDRKPVSSVDQSYIPVLRDAIDFYECPVCVRNESCDFALNNLRFNSVISSQFSPDEWFSELSTDLKLLMRKSEINVLSHPEKSSILKNVLINDFRWMILIDAIWIDDKKYTMWKFLREGSVLERDFKYPLNSCFDIPERFIFCKKMNGTEWNVFCLYFSGFGHFYISKRMNISVRTSKSIIKRVYEYMEFTSENKDDVIHYLYSCGFCTYVHNQLAKIMGVSYLLF
ncbi:hypothetical protein M5U04_13830 [Xenorhabdus sp. XENO-1]|uniref:hypothetical protein n=1 Tax=Xenorhabdus bovienii TaxID=40576 RepID=UPI0020CA3A4D|nr:hypothetical protein [Xenorhabdus bovienii]MCP9269136.1 hypothetical protein [Xenorhabdus bovienii subsp. africana]